MGIMAVYLLKIITNLSKLKGFKVALLDVVILAPAQLILGTCMENLLQNHNPLKLLPWKAYGKPKRGSCCFYLLSLTKK